MPLSVNFTRLMYVGLAFSVPGVTFDLDSLRFEVLVCGSSAKHNAAPKKQSAKINPVVCVFMRRSNRDLHFPSTFLCSRTTVQIVGAFRPRRKRLNWSCCLKSYTCSCAREIQVLRSCA